MIGINYWNFFDSFVRKWHKLTYFESFEFEHIPKEIKKFIVNKDIAILQDIYRIQAHYSVMCGYFWIGFIDFMPKGKVLIDNSNLLSPNKYNRNDKMKVKIFSKRLKWTIIVLFVVNIENLKTVKYLLFSKNQ